MKLINIFAFRTVSSNACLHAILNCIGLHNNNILIVHILKSTGIVIRVEALYCLPLRLLCAMIFPFLRISSFTAKWQLGIHTLDPIVFDGDLRHDSKTEG